MVAPPVPALPVDPSAVALLETLTSGSLTVSTLAGIGLPLLTGLVTGQAWPPWVKGAMLAALSFGSAVLTEFIAVERAGGGPVDWRAILTAAFFTWITAQVAHQGLWRNTALAARLQAVQLGPPPRTWANDPRAPWGSADDVDLGERSVAAIRARVDAETQPAAPQPAPATPPGPPPRRHTPPPPLPTAAADPGRMRRARPPRYLRDDHDGPTTLPER